MTENGMSVTSWVMVEFDLNMCTKATSAVARETNLALMNCDDTNVSVKQLGSNLF